MGIGNWLCSKDAVCMWVKNFINEFTEFYGYSLTDTVDRILIVGYFNFHACCPSAPLARDFLNVIDCFNPVQSVTATTQEHVYTLNVVLSHGFTLCDLVGLNTYISDHLMCVCRISPSHICPLVSRRQMRNAMPSHFYASYIPGSESNTYSDIDELVVCFNCACTLVLDTISPMKVCRPKPHSQPWFNNNT